MLRFFFYRSSPMVYLMNLISTLLLGCLLYRAWRVEEGGLGFSSVFLIFTYLFFNFLNLFPFYPGQKGKVGIRLHFQKNIVPMSYLMVIAFSLKLMGVSEWGLLPFVLLYLPVYYVSLILLVFHFRDSSDLAAGYFTHNFYLQEKESTCIR